MLYIFDMGGVCCNTFQLSDLCNNLGISKSDFKDICCNEDGSSIFKMLSTGEITIKSFWAEWEKRTGKKESDWFYLSFKPYLLEETVQFIRQLKKNSRVVCGTNTLESHYLVHVERGDYALFDKTYASFLMGCAKPDLSYYQLILKAEGVKPEDAVFIDDRIENVEAAASLGIHAFQFTTIEKLKQDLENSKLLPL